MGVAAEEPTYLHPDITVLCGPAEFHPREPTVVTNPRAVFEVLSPSTSVRDCNDKLPKYKAMPSIQVIAYFEPAVRRVTAYIRTERGWEEIVQTEGVLHLAHLDVGLDITALYDEAQADGGP